MAAVIGVMAVGAVGVGPSQVGAQTTPTITSSPPPPGVVGAGYLHQFTTSAETPTATFSVTSGTLPPGLSLAPTGFVTGAPTMAGTFGPTTVCGTNGVAPATCQTFTITIAKRTPGMLAAASPGGPVGTPVHDTASLVGAYVPTGTVTFRLFSDAACTVEVFASSNVVSTDGTATSSEFTPTAAGTYRWTAQYSGDANNNPVPPTCDASNEVTISGTSPSSTTIPPSSTTSTSTSTSTSTVPSSTSITPTSSSSSTVATTTTAVAMTTTSTTSTSTTSTSVPTGTTISSTTSTSTTSTTAGSTTSTTASSTTSSSTTVPASATSTTVVGTTTTTTTIPSTSTTAVGTAATAATESTTTTTTPRPVAHSSAAQAAPGDSVTLSGSGFPPGAPLEAELFSDPVLLGTTTADSGGSFVLTVTVPAGTAPGAHTVRVSVVGGSAQAEVGLLVTSPVATTAPVRPASTTLSRTGAEIAGVARLAGVLVLVGLGVLGLTRSWVPAGGAFAPRRSWPRRRRLRGRSWPPR